jgi:hypothetical protein
LPPAAQLHWNLFLFANTSKFFDFNRSQTKTDRLKEGTEIASVTQYTRAVLVWLNEGESVETGSATNKRNHSRHAGPHFGWGTR